MGAGVDPPVTASPRSATDSADSDASDWPVSSSIAVPLWSVPEVEFRAPAAAVSRSCLLTRAFWFLTSFLWRSLASTNFRSASEYFPDLDLVGASSSKACQYFGSFMQGK